MTANRSAFAFMLLIATSAPTAGCATVDCDAEAREATAPADPGARADATAECEQRIEDARRNLKQKEDQRAAEERRDAFRHRNDDRRR
jgi:hypothetical protein